ncbi:Fc.00g075130.m01.CDS01 [Cosmosporella sp. VM-42]
MTTLAKSQNVCTGCRSRKKKCSGERPSCLSCRKRGDACFYAGAPSQGFTAPGSTDWIPAPVLSDATLSVETWAPDGPNGPGGGGDDWMELLDNPEIEGWAIPLDQVQEPVETSPRNFGLPTPEDPASPPNTTALPSPALLLELVQLYFEKFYHYLPILHKSTLISKLESNDYDDCHLLLFAIVAVAASAHPNRQIQESKIRWLTEAKGLFSTAIHTADHPLQTIQAGNFIIFQTMVLTEYSAAWMTLGEAWRKAVAVGFNVQDGPAQLTLGGLGRLPSRDWIKAEECRRSVWMLFIFDRGMCFPIGLQHAIDDRRLRINLPMRDDAFQATTEPLTEVSIPYASSLDRLITSIQERTRKQSANLLQYIVLAYIFLGRVGEQIYSLESDLEEQKPHLDTLTSHLLRIRLILPRSATDLSAADYDDFTYVVWLNVIMSVSSILLYHKPLQEGETLDGQTDLSTHWPHCVAAARNTVSMVRDAARASTDIIINPHLSSKLFTCGRILIIEYICPSASRKSKDPALRDDVLILLFTFERMKEALKGCAKKFRNGTAFYLSQGEKQVQEAKAGGSRDLLKTCEKWPSAEDDEDLYLKF